LDDKVWPIKEEGLLGDRPSYVAKPRGVNAIGGEATFEPPAFGVWELQRIRKLVLNRLERA
jgi:hypothetical protein